MGSYSHQRADYYNGSPMTDQRFPTIRPATHSDAPALRELIFTILREYNLRPDPDNTDADLNDVESTYFKAGGRFDVMVDSSGEILGSVGLHRIDERTIELRKMYLRSTERGKGFGTRLLDHAMREARRMGYTRMTLETASQLKTAIGKDIVKRPYITVGFTAFVVMVPLAATSTAAMIRRLGKRWQKLHRLVYVAAIGGVVHFWWLVKADVTLPRRWAVAVALLLGFRVWWAWRAKSPAVRSASPA